MVAEFEVQLFSLVVKETLSCDKGRGFYYSLFVPLYIKKNHSQPCLREQQGLTRRINKIIISFQLDMSTRPPFLSAQKSYKRYRGEDLRMVRDMVHHNFTVLNIWKTFLIFCPCTCQVPTRKNSS